MSKFIPGLFLCEQFYNEVVKPILKDGFPGLKYSAGLIDYGSEVLGFDTKRSTDHHWGPRVMIFLSPEDISNKEKISDFLSKHLPATFLGYSTHFGEPNKLGVQLLTKVKKGQPITHRIEIYSIESFLENYLSISPNINLSSLDWLILSEQRLRTIRSGNIFYDQLSLKKIQRKLHYFPKDVWLFMLASEWLKIGQEEPFVGRTGDVGDELGSKVIAARLVHSIMKLCFLMEKEYSPYSKWFGTAFSRLQCAKKLTPILDRVLLSKKWKDRQKNLSSAYKIIAELHNKLGITKTLPTKASYFFDRPYLVIHGDVFANEIKKKIKDKAIRSISVCIGSVNQLSNSVDLLDDNKLLKKLKDLYQS
ncbi:MAG: DUF4037 domain-containing protein [Candidatus Magasanikbacteria bacterium]|nr:DUF4037 domain-containing protein [Candidatus Magasanikbacteria bacterium]